MAITKENILSATTKISICNKFLLISNKSKMGKNGPLWHTTKILLSFVLYFSRKFNFNTNYFEPNLIMGGPLFPVTVKDLKIAKLKACQNKQKGK